MDIILIKQSGAEYYHSVIDDILLMILQMFVFHILLEIFEKNNRRKWNGCFIPSANDNTVIQPEVREEKKRVEEHMKCKRKKIKNQ